MSQLKRKYTVSVSLFLPTQSKHLKRKLKELQSVPDTFKVDIEHQGKTYTIPFSALLTKFNRVDITESDNSKPLTVKSSYINDSLRKWIGNILTQQKTTAIDLDKLVLSSPKVVNFYASEELTPEQFCAYVNKAKSTYAPSKLVKQVYSEVGCELDTCDITDITDDEILTTMSRLSLVTLRHLLPTQVVDIDLTKLYDIYRQVEVYEGDTLPSNLRTEYLIELREINKQLKDVNFPTIGFTGRFFNMYIGKPLFGSRALFDISCLGIEVLLDAQKLLDVITLSRLLESTKSLDLSRFTSYEDKTLLVLADIITNVSPTEIIHQAVKANDIDNSFLQTLSKEQWQFYHILDCLKTLTRTTMTKLSELSQIHKEVSQDELSRSGSSSNNQDK
ncbi:MAG: hypothetical protein DRP47_11395 [Candidatus Zixiibacteriota bacterium]|nr:MAG: hypothetical protein DRP47_11395 [candidate division Zixibacteria bacterium]